MSITAFPMKAFNLVSSISGDCFTESMRTSSLPPNLEIADTTPGENHCQRLSEGQFAGLRSPGHGAGTISAAAFQTRAASCQPGRNVVYFLAYLWLASPVCTLRLNSADRFRGTLRDCHRSWAKCLASKRIWPTW